MRPPRLDKALGQHHLVSGSLCRPLIEFLQPGGQRVVEVGPGGGVLTAELLAAGARGLAWEGDLAWAAELRRRCRRSPRWPGWPPWPGSGIASPAGRGSGGPPPAIVVGDALDLPWGRLPAPTLAAGNLPYNIATALLGALLPHHLRVPRAAFLVQREVAERLLARPGDPAYGSLRVLVAGHPRAGP